MKLPLSRPDIGWRSRGTDLAIGALGVLGLAPFQFWPATVLSFALLFIRLSGHAQLTPHEPWRGTSTGFWTGIGYFAAGMFWIASAFVERGPEYIPLIVPLVFGLFVLLSVFWAWAGRAFVMIAPRPMLAPLLFASLWFAAEFTRGHLFGGFPWNLPGYAWEAGTAMSQLASVVGIYGLSYILLLVSGMLGAAWLSRDGVSRDGVSRDGVSRALLVPGGAALAVLAGLWGYGTARLPDAPVATLPDTRLRLVHVPFRQSEMMDMRRAIPITNRYFQRTFEAPLATPEGAVTHIVWPEGAVRGVAVDDYDFLSVISEVTRLEDDDADIPHFLFSSIRTEERPVSAGNSAKNSAGSSAGIGDELWFNSAVSVSYPDGYPAVSGVSDKHRLVPMGEVVPFGDTLSKIGFEAIAASFTPAPDKSNRTFPGLPEASVQICYEVLFPGLTEGEPSLILNQSNDAWFGRTTGPAQHAATARMRALEQGVPLVRSAANGWSGTVDAWGRWVERVGPTEDTHRDVSVPAQTLDTPFSRLTHAILLLISLSGCLCIIGAGRTPTRGVADMVEGTRLSLEGWRARLPG